ncbi:protein of unknown function [Klenkia soli]|uniref:DUF4062 domain-containing protein n=2 Tax=Klenkia soli TaxID=1052260 RepID=A0A1H0U6T2_9ACTN|nr:protein of unknown function [Klenkia soli]
MELFPASDSEKWNLIQGVIDLCDYYVVIVGGRYGSVDDVEQISYTEMEFDYAVEKNKPVMGFLHGNPGKLIAERVDLDPELREKLEKFRAKIENKMVKYWNEPGDLPGQVALAIMQTRKSHPAVGWIRGNHAMTPIVQQELVELRARVRELSAELHDEQRQGSLMFDPADLMQGDETASLRCQVEFHYQWRIDAKDAFARNRAHGIWVVKPTWNDVFKHIGPELMDEASEEYLRERLTALCDRLTREDLLDDDDDDDNNNNDADGVEGDAKEDRRVGAIYDVEVTLDSFNDVKVQFSALGLIANGSKRRPGSDTNTYWRLTDRGTQQLLRLRALRTAKSDGIGSTAQLEQSETRS